jgi:NAD(P)-dependent dehydrogenase (short-subunit alcohol dehydrogenase family)
MNWFDDFRDKVVIITGASSGIGRETALAFAAEGARVVLVARRQEVLEKLQREIVGGGGQALVVATDVTRRKQVRACMKTVRREYGRIDVVINNAGVLIPAAFADIREEDLQSMLRVNLFGALFVMQEALRAMRKQGHGSIVNVASLAGRRGIAPLGGYCATKFALVGLTEALRTELEDDSIHIALVEPGVIDTPMAHGAESIVGDLWPAAFNMPPEWVVWAIFAALRLRLVEISVPPGSATLEKIAALTPGLTDAVLRLGRTTTSWLAAALGDRK